MSEEGATGRFSERYGYAPKEGAEEITIREEAPEHLQRAVLEIAVKAGLDYDDLLDLAAKYQAAERPWDLVRVESGKSSKVNLERLLREWPWFRVYDFIELLYEKVKKTQFIGGLLEPRVLDQFLDSHIESQIPGATFALDMNRYFEHAGIGWKLVDGKIQARGSESFEVAVGRATEELEASGLQTAKQEIYEALQDLSRRPKADLTGAIHHSMAALECVAREVTGDSKATLGGILKKHADLLPKPLDQALAQVWGYASEKARHLREGSEPEREEAELVVSLAASAAAYLSQKFR